MASRSPKSDVIIIDCLTVYLDNVMRAKRGAVVEIERDFQEVCQAIRTSKSSVIIVSNEVGCGIVPAFRSGRRYRDLLGRLNQQVAEIADQVILMVAGIPLTVKDTAGH